MTSLLPIAAVALLVAAVERPLWPSRPAAGRERRAALAIRDDVIPFQKWGTRAFTLPYLERHYDRVWYFTQSKTERKRAEFEGALAEALGAYDAVDLFLLAHANAYVSWVADLDPALRSRLRLVYNTGCGDADQAARWLELGAKSYVGHVGESNSPVFYVYFLRRWVLGERVGEATDEGNALMARALRRQIAVGVSEVDVCTEVDGSIARCFGRADLTIGP